MRQGRRVCAARGSTDMIVLIVIALQVTLYTRIRIVRDSVCDSGSHHEWFYERCESRSRRPASGESLLEPPPSCNPMQGGHRSPSDLVRKKLLRKVDKKYYFRERNVCSKSENSSQTKIADKVPPHLMPREDLCVARSKILANHDGL